MRRRCLVWLKRDTIPNQVQRAANLHVLGSFLHLHQPLQVAHGLHASHARLLPKQKTQRSAPSSLRHRRRRTPTHGNG